MDNPLVQLDPGLFVWTIVTFLLLLLVLAKFAWNPLLKILKEREELIQSSLKDAERAQHELSQLNSEGEAIVNKARAEAQKILSESKAASSKMKDEILKDAKEKAKSLAAMLKNRFRLKKKKLLQR
ncbi:MAG: hypothetical protein Ct9H300mP29_1800 [Candidatus Neomarinimicrobiota bacterium]|nr:MAG: hypothetical protein Ct9H300mP29_1800 [Candidatus Neomarinimicrobiota bacterium]